LTLQEKDLGKISNGEFLKISSTRVPRLIGKRGSMIQTIEQATQTRILIGQNGILVVTGKSNEGIALAFKAIRLVEEEAHTSNLTQRVKDLLNVSEDTSQSETNNSSMNNEDYVNNNYADNNSNDIKNGHNSNNNSESSERDSA